jgi:simple sugar transport system permease protein
MNELMRRFHSAPLVDSLIAILLAVLLIGFVMLLSGHDPFRIVALFICGSLGDLEALYGTFMSSMPLIFSGLSLAVAFRAGLFNIGGEGQIFVGGLAAAALGHYLNLGPLTVFAMAAVAALAGFAWAMVPITIKLYRGAHEVIGCIMMNYVAINFSLWLVRGSLRADASTEKTPPIVEGGWWPNLDSVGATNFNFAFIFGLIVAAALTWLIFHRPFGFELRSAGANPGAARAAGIRVNRTFILAFGLSGAIAGLGGAAGVSGLYGSFNSQFSPGYGFDGITVALLGRNHPVGVIAAALLFGMMRNASKLLQWEAEISPDVVFLFQGFVILALIAAAPTRRLLARLIGRNS